jgi:plastocyanin
MKLKHSIPNSEQNNSMKIVIPSLLMAAAVSGALLLTGCGSETTAEAKTDTKAASSAPSEPVRDVHEISMRGDASGFFFEPKEITIRQGDLVRWKMVDGAPHNVNFAGRAFPGSAKVLLESRKKLVGVTLQAPGQTYEIHFTEAYPVGEYNYVCDPHAVLNMAGKIIVTD